MISYPNAKINIGLNILSKRPDGYHNISSCFYPIPFTDILEILPSEDFKFQSTGLKIPGNDNENLCIKAFNLMKEQYNISNVTIHLHKIIPMGAGLGGGSADASFTLKMLDEQFSLNLSEQTLENHASQLGSDCPFFIRNIPIIAKETGFKFKPTTLSLEGKYLVLLNPGIHISTAKAYGGVTPKMPAHSIEEIITKPVGSWKNTLQNDFENSVFKHAPEVKEIKDRLYESGAIYASMTGSGSSIYGIFQEEIKIPSNINKHVCWKGFLD